MFIALASTQPYTQVAGVWLYVGVAMIVMAKHMMFTAAMRVIFLLSPYQDFKQATNGALKHQQQVS